MRDFILLSSLQDSCIFTFLYGRSNGYTRLSVPGCGRMS